MLSHLYRRSLVVLVPVASAVGFGFIGCGSGEEPRSNDEPIAASSLRLAFPAQADRIFEIGEPLVESADAFVRAPEAARPKGSLSVRLPKQGSQPVVLRAPSGLEVRVRQQVEGEGRLVGKTVAYERAGGSSFWTVGARGAEAWIELESASPETPVGSWEVEGGTLRQTEDLVEVLDEAGIAHFRMRAPVAYGEGEREIPVRIEVRDARIDFYVDANEQGSVLVAPEWTGTGSMTTPRVHHSVTLLANGKVLVVGGKSGTSDATALGTAEIFDPTTETFTLVVPASGSLSARFAHTASLLRDGSGRVLVAGGFPGANGAALTSAQLYNPTTNVWSNVGNLGSARGSHGAVALANGGVMVAGGMSGNAGASIRITGVEIFDPNNQSWSSAGTNLGVGRRNPSLAQLVDESVLVIGGDTSSNPPSRAVDRYNPTTRQRISYTATGLNAGRSASSAVTLLDGRVLVTNGAIAGSSSSYGEVYSLATNAWTTTGAMRGNRTGAPAVLLDGKVLVAGGGASAAGALATAELYDPVANEWSDAPSLNQARRFSGAAALADGRVLIVGGEGPSGILASAELYAAGEEDLCAGVVCDPEGACTEAGVCDPADGSCSYANKADGTSCDDGNPATVNDVCTAGVCAGVDLCAGVSCGAETECQEAGVCNPADGSCSQANKADGTACSGGTCSAGVCVEESPDGGVIEDPDAGPIEDAGPDAEPGDAGEDEDAGVDGGADAGEDASTDAGDEDDAGLEDAGDAGDEEDAGLDDAGADAAPGDAGTGGSGGSDEPGTGDPDAEVVNEGGGCGCRTTGGPTGQGGAIAALALVGAVLARKRRG